MNTCCIIICYVFKNILVRSSVTLKFAGGYMQTAETYKSWNNNKKPQPIICVAYNANELLLLIVGY